MIHQMCLHASEDKIVTEQEDFNEYRDGVRLLLKLKTCSYCQL